MNPSSLEGPASLLGLRATVVLNSLAVKREAHREEGHCLLIPQEHGFGWHCVLKGISFAGTMSDVIHNFYEKCRSRFYFFLPRRPVKAGGSDKDLNSARRQKGFENLILQCCVCKADTTTGPYSPIPTCPLLGQALLEAGLYMV